MKKIIILFLLLPSLLFAQGKSNIDLTFNKKLNWKLAIGVSMLNNIEYSTYQEKQPIVLNLRYNFKNNHVLRINTPVTYRAKIFGDSNGDIFKTYSSPEVLAKDILNSGINTTDYDLVLDNRYNLYGLSIGYDYNYHLVNKLSAFAGFDVGLYLLNTYTKYYNVSYSTHGQEVPEIQLSSVTFGTTKIHTNNISVKPIIGLRYQFQYLLIEGAIGYNFKNEKFHRFDEFVTYYTETEKTETKSYDSEHNPANGNKFIYLLNLLYIF